jgi:hypothetical protein
MLHSCKSTQVRSQVQVHDSIEAVDSILESIEFFKGKSSVEMRIKLPGTNLQHLVAIGNCLFILIEIVGSASLLLGLIKRYLSIHDRARRGN